MSATRTGEHFWARGDCVSTVGDEEEKVRAYIREQEGGDDEGGSRSSEGVDCQRPT